MQSVEPDLDLTRELSTARLIDAGRNFYPSILPTT